MQALFAEMRKAQTGGRDVAAELAASRASRRPRERLRLPDASSDASLRVDAAMPPRGLARGRARAPRLAGRPRGVAGDAPPPPPTKTTHDPSARGTRASTPASRPRASRGSPRRRVRARSVTSSAGRWHLEDPSRPPAAAKRIRRARVQRSSHDDRPDRPGLDPLPVATPSQAQPSPRASTNEPRAARRKPSAPRGRPRRSSSASRTRPAIASASRRQSAGAKTTRAAPSPSSASTRRRRGGRLGPREDPPFLRDGSRGVNEAHFDKLRAVREVRVARGAARRRRKKSSAVARRARPSPRRSTARRFAPRAVPRRAGRATGRAVRSVGPRRSFRRASPSRRGGDGAVRVAAD